MGLVCLDDCCSPATTGHFLNPTFSVIVSASQFILFFFLFSFLSTFASKRKKSERRRCSPLPDMRHWLFISQACHINTGWILGQDAERRNKNSAETKKNVRINHRGEKLEGGTARSVKIQFVWRYNGLLTPLTYTYSRFLLVLLQLLLQP